LRWVKPCGSASTKELPRKLLPTRTKETAFRLPRLYPGTGKLDTPEVSPG
jgi:hypothetical protein